MASGIAQQWKWTDEWLEHQRYRKANRFIRKDDIVLDLGCGDGGLSRYLARKDKTVSYMGIDGKSNIDNRQSSLIVEADLNKDLPLADASVDVVVALALIEHLIKPYYFILESSRVLKPGGRLVMTTPSPKSKPILESLAFFGIISKEDIRDHKRYFSKKDLEEGLKPCFAYYETEQFQMGLNTLAVAFKSFSPIRTDPDHVDCEPPRGSIGG